jgi:hypothetical protein
MASNQLLFLAPHLRSKALVNIPRTVQSWKKESQVVEMNTMRRMDLGMDGLDYIADLIITA